MGLRRAVTVHENRAVLVSVGRSGELRIHRGYAYSADRVLKAVITFVNQRGRALRNAAEREIVTFAVDEFVPSKRVRRRGRIGPQDRRVLAELRRLHAQFNQLHFGGELSPIPLRISNRMRTRLGEVTLDHRSLDPLEIAISRRHIDGDAWNEVEQTLLHEMVHQWQAERGLEIDHGPAFRRKAREVGVPPLAHRTVDVAPQAAGRD